jgi:predicted dehydrogenase
VSPPIRWGILATGNIAAAFVDDLRLLSDAEVVAVGSRSIDAAQPFAATHGIPRTHGSWQALADDPANWPVARCSTSACTRGGATTSRPPRFSAVCAPV